MASPPRVKLVEVSPRDGLQNEARQVPTAVKIELVNRLTAAGFPNIETTSFVSPKWVPQMADGADVLAGIVRGRDTVYSALVPNMRGFEAALASQVDEVAIFTAASEAFCQRNTNCSITESIERFVPVVEAARAAGVRLRGSISCALGCPYEGDVPAATVGRIAAKLRDLGCDEIDVADTLGVGTANRVREAVRAAAAEFPIARISGHFHDTYGQALANILAAFEDGVGIFHSSVAGLGGCPYAPGAAGNVATEDVLYLFAGLGVETGVDLDTTVRAGEFIAQAMGRVNGSRAGRALLAKCGG